ncbi:fibronectin type III domain-containing protein [Psychromonas hadalis]|uniref:fibronectin type III domain-containing protein n=1 Tax=Psychromonas hadalis TaxID=211669 RepID=UPI0003B47394|nr:fibronectin type III domain-containing protein [Psychromonas hadalis]
MNQQLSFVNKCYLTLLACLLLNSMAFAESLQINWADNSDNEDVFIVEKRFLQSDTFQRIAVLSENTTHYNDADVNIDETYCYRISAFNQAGQSISSESCMKVTETSSSPSLPSSPSTPAPSYPDFVEASGNMSISHQFIARPVDIEIGDKEFYSFKNNALYNDWYSEDEIFNVNFYVNEGRVGHHDLDYFSFQQQGEELENGYASMKFNTENSLSFVLQGNGSEQIATLYMKAGAWSSDASSIIVTVGDEVEVITLPKGYSWFYFSVDIEFDGTAPVTITTDSERAGYSSVMFAGLVLNNENNANVIKYASMVDVDSNFGDKIDISEMKFMTSRGETGNEDNSGASIESLDFYGKGKIYNSRYVYINPNGENYTGYRYMGWSESNGVAIKLKSAESQVSNVSLYFKTGIWSHEASFVELMINGESQLIEIAKGYRWYYMKVDIEFEGELDLDLHPYEQRGGYSALGFAGLTLN